MELRIPNISKHWVFGVFLKFDIQSVLSRITLCSLHIYIQPLLGKPYLTCCHAQFIIQVSLNGLSQNFFMDTLYILCLFKFNNYLNTLWQEWIINQVGVMFITSIWNQCILKKRSQWRSFAVKGNSFRVKKDCCNTETVSVVGYYPMVHQQLLSKKIVL